MIHYGTVDEVAALCRWMLSGESTFNSTTRPTGAQVEKFLERASGVLNLALAQHGFGVPVTEPTAELACDEWTVERAVAMAELSYPTSGDMLNEHALWLRDNMQRHATDFVKMNALGFKNLGVTTTNSVSQGLVFTAETAQADRSDPDNTGLEQPKFRRGQFDS